MIKINGIEVILDKFGDGTLKCDYVDSNGRFMGNNPKFDIMWCYDNDGELFALQCIVDYIKNKYVGSSIELDLPYIPNARQDRYVSNKLFTLKTFAKIINGMGFDTVFVYDPHSDVSTALLDRCTSYPNALKCDIPKSCVVMYPDAGAAKKYNVCEDKAIIGKKHRNKDGIIDSYELLNFVKGTKSVVIRDDICSYGGTFVAAAKALRERGVERIVLIVSHCENNILKGDVLKYIDDVYTTDSICTVEHPHVHVIKRFRG